MGVRTKGMRMPSGVIRRVSATLELYLFSPGCGQAAGVPILEEDPVRRD